MNRTGSRWPAPQQHTAMTDRAGLHRALAAALAGDSGSSLAFHITDNQVTITNGLDTTVLRPDPDGRYSLTDLDQVLTAGAVTDDRPVHHPATS